MVTYTDARPICLAGDWYAVRAGFTWERSGASLSFECDDEQDAQAWVALALAKDGVTEGRPPGAPGGGADAPHDAGMHPVSIAAAQVGSRADPTVRAPAAASYPHESEYGGGKDYVSAPYNGGKSILEPENVFFAKDEDEWRCWPSGPLPPNAKILGTDQNIMTYGADEGVKVLATEHETGKFGVGVGLKQAHRGIEISDGRFGVQISEIAPGGAAWAARNAGKNIRVGDYILYVDGWSCSQRHSSEVASKMVGEEGSQVLISVARPIGPSRVFAQPWWWIQAGVTRFDTCLTRARIQAEPDGWWEIATRWIPGSPGL